MRALAAISLVALVPLVTACKGSSEPATPAPSSPSCQLWAKGVRRVATRVQGGRGDFFRELSFDVAGESLQVHDSDPFATGNEEKTPRVLQKSKTLSAGERDTLVKGLFGVCPSADAMKRQCAPGGCARLEVTDSSGATTKVEDAETVRAVANLMAPHFPDLR